MNTHLSADDWMAVLERLAEALGRDGPPVRLCLIGSAACLFGGMDGRTSHDLDVWRPASDYDRLELKRAAEAAGLALDPKTTLEPDRPYLQFIEPGPTELGSFAPVLVDRLGRLEIYRPPIENLIAAKLIRGEPKDLGDIRFLVSRHRPDFARVREVIAQFSSRGQEQAGENLVYLDILNP
jgi:hypothetical protein